MGSFLKLQQHMRGVLKMFWSNPLSKIYQISRYWDLLWDFIFKLIHPKQDDNSTNMQWATECKRMKKKKKT